jgi:hypothetical protein
VRGRCESSSQRGEAARTEAAVEAEAAPASAASLRASALVGAQRPAELAAVAGELRRRRGTLSSRALPQQQRVEGAA